MQTNDRTCRSLRQILGSIAWPLMQISNTSWCSTPKLAFVSVGNYFRRFQSLNHWAERRSPQSTVQSAENHFACYILSIVFSSFIRQHYLSWHIIIFHVSQQSRPPQRGQEPPHALHAHGRPALRQRRLASGSFEPGQYGAIREAIDDAFDYGLTGDTFACNISTALNNQFDRFWNVVSGKVRDLQYDAVLFGYAYKQHWFWINNYRDNKFVIVWKDYNCGTEFSRSFIDWEDDTNWAGYLQQFPLYWENLGGTFYERALPTNDIWAGIYSTIQDLQDNPNQANTVTGVAAFGGFFELSVCICHLTGGNWLYEWFQTPTTWTQWFVFETRAGKTPLTPLPSSTP